MKSITLVTSFEED